MTSDLLTLEMFKAKPKNASSGNRVITQPLAFQGTLPSIEAGGLMKKETNVEFAAIIENNGFLGQEWGAQHGIWSWLVLTKANMQFVPLIKKDWYQVRLDGFKVMGEPVLGMQNLSLPKPIVDSGTTNILMNQFNLQFLIRSMAQSSIIRWSSLIPGRMSITFGPEMQSFDCPAPASGSRQSHEL
ncbi:hypothetical protein BGZ65_007278 [Modicella reniformis]|uniref:Uncharacterized protein n=1 Tax=Modicella reniformis TaxID=1440133 RepID=A0A9P6LS14_9FUNG|nr:hypothetical protein BGZ65_007278 [Modicella reniformis]